MPWSTLADAVLLLHLAFVAFVLFGALLCLRWPRLAWVHVPCAAWSVWVNLAGWYCPLTPLEITLRRAAGEGFYEGSFIAHYLAPLVYPRALSPTLILAMAGAIAAWNALLYALVYWRHGRRRQ
ncbi:DUF2784 domain-containing protein [Ectothiorhodospiraceae bacterium WFHF3C12]|nr:DUF2784 domain-containing protein [Ectothiorhodospiraceae bacterium WFHF3C12]